MIVIPLEEQWFITTLGVVLTFELLRILIAYILAADPSELKQAREEKLALQSELATIKSVQLEFVRHSLLSRKVIKLEKQIDEIAVRQGPLRIRVQRALQILRLFLFVGGGLYVQRTLVARPVLKMEPQVSYRNHQLLSNIIVFGLDLVAALVGASRPAHWD